MTQILSSDEILSAAQILRCGGLVAIPTENVSGLAGDAQADAAVAQIFSAKARPTFNPLIVHVSSADAAAKFVKWNDAADQLAQAFWPGALTLVLPLRKGHGLSPLVTSGLDTVAIRVPAHPVAKALLQEFHGPLAAPSANPSGRLSPTTAAHVMDGLSGQIDAVLDGGACSVGLESTIIGLSEAPTVLRPGGIPAEVIEKCLGQELFQHQGGINAPGQMASHYAPNAALRLNAMAAEDGELHLGFGQIVGDQNLSPAGDLVEAAANLFAFLHALDGTAKKIALAPIPETGLGVAINDRLRRASAPREGS